MATAEKVEKDVKEIETPLYQDIYRPVLKNSPSLQHSDEQDAALKRLLAVCCSDSRFAQKAYDSLVYILSQIEPPPETPLTTRVIGEIPSIEEVARRKAEEKKTEEELKKAEKDAENRLKEAKKAEVKNDVKKVTEA